MSRIIVAFDLLRIQHRALEIGARLARYREAELTVLFIESVELQRAAELPFVREIDRLSATLQPFGPERLERLWRRRLAEVRRWLAELQERFSFPGRLQIETGRYPETVLEWSRDNDLLILSTPASGPSRRCPPVWVWYDASEAAQRALNLGRQLAEEQGYPLRIAAPPGVTPELPEPVTTIPEAQLADFLAGQECTAVFCPRNHPQAARLPLRARCPVLLV